LLGKLKEAFLRGPVTLHVKEVVTIVLPFVHVACQGDAVLASVLLSEAERRTNVC
jgi:hypothetical protein